MDTVAEDLRRAWHLRFEDRNEECQLLFLRICQMLGLPTDLDVRLDFSRLLTGDNKEQIVEGLTLSASLNRARGQGHLAESFLVSIEKTLTKTGIAATFAFYFERGVQCFIRGDYSLAQNFFMLAHLRGNDSFERCAAQINALLCLDNLGLPLTHTLGELEAAFRFLDPEDARTPCITSQLEHFRARLTFRRGDWQALVDMPTDASRWGQTRYLKLWISQLPYLEVPFGGDEELEAFLNFSGYYPCHSYCTRTLLGLTHPSDFEVVRWTNWADRFYLWTWKWLRDPDGFSFERIAWLLRYWQESAADAALFLTREDRLMVRNALTWLTLLDSTKQLKLSHLLKLVNIPAGWECPLLDFEYEVARYLLARRDYDKVLAQDFYANLTRHPLWTDTRLGFCDLIASVDGSEVDLTPPLNTLAEHLRSLLNEIPSNYAIVVDIEAKSIVQKKGNVVVCEASCNAIDILRRVPTISLKDFVAGVFSIKKYDSLVHNQRVFSCLRKLRLIFGEYLAFSTKNSSVVCDGDWSEIYLQLPGVYHELNHNATWRRLPQSALNSGKKTNDPTQADLSRDILKKEILTRKEMERLTGKARSTAHRLLSEWEEKGLVEREGYARATFYRITPRLRTYLSGGQAWN